MLHLADLTRFLPPSRYIHAAISPSDGPTSTPRYAANRTASRRAPHWCSHFVSHTIFAFLAPPQHCIPAPHTATLYRPSTPEFTAFFQHILLSSRVASPPRRVSPVSAPARLVDASAASPRSTTVYSHHKPSTWHTALPDCTPFDGAPIFCVISNTARTVCSKEADYHHNS